MFQLILVYLQLLWAILFINTDTKLVKNALVRQWKCGFIQIAQSNFQICATFFLKMLEIP